MEKLLWTRRGFIKGVAAFAGAGMLQPVFPLIGAGKSIAAAYPEEVLSIEKYTKGRVKVGDIISSDNADLIKDIAPESLVIELKRGGRIKITDTTLDPDAVNYHPWNEATLRNKGQAVLDKKGQLWHKNGGPWIGGNPFPEPKTGIEIMWNHTFNPRRHDDIEAIDTGVNIDHEGRVVRRDMTSYMQIQTTGRVAVDPKPAFPKYKDELHRTLLFLLRPFDSYGQSVASTVFYDAIRLPDTDLYIPSLKRTRRVPSTQRFEAIFPFSTLYSSDFEIHADPLLTWSWKLVGSKPMLAPSPLNIGARFKNPTKDDFIWPLLDPPQKFPSQSWELRPEMFLIDGVANLPGCPYKVKRVYVDGIYQRSQMGEIWDLAGKLWKFIVFIVADTGLRDKAGYKIQDVSGILSADLQKDFHTNLSFYGEFEGYKFTANLGRTIDDNITPSVMLRRAMK